MESVKFVPTQDISVKIEALFESEKQKLIDLFKGLEIDIEHVGGTSVPDSISKGDLDINIRVKPMDFKRVIEILKKIYKINQPENWSPEFASFKDDARNLGIQLTIKGSKEDYFVAQREYLKIHPEKVTELNALKEMFEGKSMEEYRKAKNEFFKNLNVNL